MRVKQSNREILAQRHIERHVLFCVVWSRKKGLETVGAVGVGSWDLSLGFGLLHLVEPSGMMCMVNCLPLRCYVGFQALSFKRACRYGK